MKGRIGDSARISHVLDAILEIESYLENIEFEVFIRNSMMRYACIKQIEIIGEACNHISDTIKTEFTDIEWAQIIAMRNILVHEYFGVDSTLVWQIVKEDIPFLKEKFLEILKSIDNQA